MNSRKKSRDSLFVYIEEGREKNYFGSKFDGFLEGKSENL